MRNRYDELVAANSPTRRGSSKPNSSSWGMPLAGRRLRECLEQLKGTLAEGSEEAIKKSYQLVERMTKQGYGPRYKIILD